MADNKQIERREFYIDTPLGKLKVWAKHKVDSPEDFPGVYVDFINEDGEAEMIACVEYDSCDGKIQTCLYQPMEDEPSCIQTFDLERGN